MRGPEGRMGRVPLWAGLKACTTTGVATSTAVAVVLVVVLVAQAFRPAVAQQNANPIANFIETVFKAGVGYDPEKLIASVRGQVGIWSINATTKTRRSRRYTKKKNRLFFVFLRVLRVLVVPAGYCPAVELLATAGFSVSFCNRQFSSSAT